MHDMKRRGLILATLVCILSLAPTARLKAQAYDPVPVTVSTEKVTLNGKVYLYHTVMERQTLYSISKAYGVTVDEIYEANPTLHRTGLLKNSVILVPYKEKPADELVSDGQAPKAGTYVEHVVKWYETLEDIAALYGISEQDIMAFNHLEDSKLTRRQVLLIPVQGQEPVNDQASVDNPSVSDPGNDISTDNPVTAEDNTEEPEEDLPVVVTLPDQDTTKVNEFVYTDDIIGDGNHDDQPVVGKTIVNMGLVLPFNADSRASIMTMDFYAGALLALRDLQAEGVYTHLTAFDIKAAVPTRAQLNKNDFILGPISVADLKTLLDVVDGETTIISPLDQKAIALRDTFPNFIQAPSYVENQYLELAQWLSEGISPGETVILVSEKAGTATCSAMREALEAKGIRYEILFYNISEGSRIPARLASMMQKGRNNHVVVASENEHFVSDAMRNLSIMDSRGYKVISYGTSKLRLLDMVDNNYYHQTSMHLTSAYYVDYESPEVIEFIKAFRALYNTEPSQFAFQGYDTAYYFISMCAQFGDRWKDFMDRDKVRMLHTDFLFNKYENGSLANGAIRRIIYKPDMSLVLER